MDVQKTKGIICIMFQIPYVQSIHIENLKQHFQLFLKSRTRVLELSYQQLNSDRETFDPRDT